MNNVDVALFEKPVGTGLTTKEVLALLSKVKGDEVYLIEIENTNGTSSAIGFVSASAANQNSFSEEMLKTEIAKILDDVSLENAHNQYSVCNANVILLR